jgi:hypothetical protein
MAIYPAVAFGFTRARSLKIKCVSRVSLFQDNTKFSARKSFSKSPILPVENVITLIAAMGCVSHALCGTLWDKHS